MCPTIPFLPWDNLVGRRYLQRLSLLGREAECPLHLSLPSTSSPSLHREEAHTLCTVYGCSDSTAIGSNPGSVIYQPHAFTNPYTVYMHICISTCVYKYVLIFSHHFDQIPDKKQLKGEKFLGLVVWEDIVHPSRPGIIVAGGFMTSRACGRDASPDHVLVEQETDRQEAVSGKFQDLPLVTQFLQRQTPPPAENQGDNSHGTMGNIY